MKTRFEKIADHSPVVAKSNESFIKKAGEIMAKAQILQELLDKVYQSAKNAIQVIQQKIRTLVNTLESKVTLACRFYEPKDDPDVQFKFQKSVFELDMFTQMNTVGIHELETLLQKYAESLKKVEELSPNLV